MALLSEPLTVASSSKSKIKQQENGSSSCQTKFAGSACFSENIPPVEC